MLLLLLKMLREDAADAAMSDPDAYAERQPFSAPS